VNVECSSYGRGRVRLHRGALDCLNPPQEFALERGALAPSLLISAVKRPTEPRSPSPDFSGIWRKKSLFLRKHLRHRASTLLTRKETWAMSAPAKANEIDPLLHPAQVAKLLGVSLSWLAKSRLTGTGPRFIKIG
jgi:hypothetical protein